MVRNTVQNIREKKNIIINIIIFIVLLLLLKLKKTLSCILNRRYTHGIFYIFIARLSIEVIKLKKKKKPRIL